MLIDGFFKTANEQLYFIVLSDTIATRSVNILTREQGPHDTALDSFACGVRGAAARRLLRPLSPESTICGEQDLRHFRT
jgi:hypothetical protein